MAVSGRGSMRIERPLRFQVASRTSRNVPAVLAFLHGAVMCS